MKITLIEPAMIKMAGFSEKATFMLQPLTLVTLAGLTPPHIEVEAVDDRHETIDFEAPRDLVGISVKTFTARRAYQIAAEFRARGVPVVLGGHHPTLLPEEAAQHADALVLGEAEGVWEDVLADAVRGRLRPIYRSGDVRPLENVRTNRSVLAHNRYLPVTLIETTRGCPFACNFCSVTRFFGRSFRHRPPAEVIGEIEANPQHLYFFVDDNIVADKEAAKALFRALIPLKIRWVSQASLTMTRDLELMRLMRASGCAGVLVGIESLADANLRQLNKGWNKVGLGYVEALKIARDHGIAIVGSFMLGMDGDTPEALDQLLAFTIEQRLFAALFNMLTPYPGTQLYDTMLRAGRLRQPKWWIDPDFAYGVPVIQPKGIGVQALAEKRLRMMREFYGVRSMTLRLLDPRANVRDLWHGLTFLGLNLPANRDELRRFGHALGTS